MITLIRHGQSTTNEQRLLVGRSDAHLTELGERQARALVPYLTDVDEVWVSPLARARETATLALPGHRPIVKDAFIEVDYGDLDGTSLAHITTEHWRAFEFDHDVAFGGGESLADVDKRVHAALERLLEDESSLLHSSTRHLAIVSHVSPIKSAIVWALGASGATAWRMRLANGSMSVIGVRAHAPQLIRYNAVPLP
ncbi:MAG TPA: histidine phosphatase family protein [Acidimicrobiales bacterium]|nr:histidine phosphatase family protein [Acidimicrobiales bacterium]